MKKIALLILLSAFTCAFTIGCGGDEPDTTPKSSSSGSQSGGGTTPPPSPDDPYINESSIECDVPNMIITFQGTPNKGFIEVLFRQLTNGDAERRMNVSRDNTKQLYYVKLTKLTGGSEFAFHVLAYNQYNQEVFRSAERRFTLPKEGSPAAPTLAGIQVFSPTSHVATDGYATGGCLTKAMEYSTDEGESWTPVAEAGAIRNLPPGKVLVRLTETATSEASLPAFFIIPKYKSNTDLDGDGGTSPGLRSPRREAQK